MMSLKRSKRLYNWLCKSINRNHMINKNFINYYGDTMHYLANGTPFGKFTRREFELAGGIPVNMKELEEKHFNL